MIITIKIKKNHKCYLINLLKSLNFTKKINNNKNNPKLFSILIAKNKNIG